MRGWRIKVKERLDISAHLGKPRIKIFVGVLKALLDSEATLVTPRLRLEPLRKKHASKLFHQLQDARLYRYYGGKPPQTVGALRKQYAAWETRQSPDGTQTWLNYALLRAKDEVYVGWLQATIEGRVATIGYDIFPKFWRNGYATEGCAALVRLLQAVESIHVIRAVVDTENEPSVRLLKRLGFTLKSSAPSEDMAGRQDFHYELARR